MQSTKSQLSSEERDRLIEENLPLVRYAVRKMHIANPPAGLDFDDLVGHGTLGLIQAVDRFDGGHGVQFSSFAITRIRGAVLDALRSLDPIGRPTRTMAKLIDTTFNTLALELGREPTACEVQRTSGIEPDRYWRARAAASITKAAHHFPVFEPGRDILGLVRDALFPALFVGGGVLKGNECRPSAISCRTSRSRAVSPEGV